MQQRLHKFRRDPDRIHNRKINDRSVAIIATIARYRFIPTSLLIRLVPGNEDVTHRHLQYLYHKGFINRFTFPRLGTPGEFIYYLDSTAALQLLVEHGGHRPEDLDWEGVRRNKEKSYADIHDRTRADVVLGRLLFLHHEVMISRFHGALELACQRSSDSVELAAWRQGSDLWNSVEVPLIRYDSQAESWYEEDETEILPHRPDAFFTLRFPGMPEGQQRANFFYEADRKNTVVKKFRKKLRAHFHFIVRQRKHEEHYGIKRIRAVLIETLDAGWAEELRQAARHFTVSGEKLTPLFWFTTSELFTKQHEITEGKTVQRTRKVPQFLLRPEIVFDRIWATPVDNALHSLLE